MYTGDQSWPRSFPCRYLPGPEVLFTEGSYRVLIFLRATSRSFLPAFLKREEVWNLWRCEIFLFFKKKSIHLQILRSFETNFEFYINPFRPFVRLYFYVNIKLYKPSPISNQYFIIVRITRIYYYQKNSAWS